MILVTGGTGLVGTYLLYELASKGRKIRALIRPGRSEHFVQSLFSCIDCNHNFNPTHIEWVEGDVLDLYSLDQAMEGVNQVYHSAGMISFYPRERALMQKINIEGTANIVDCSMRHGVQKLIHVSSISALGSNTEKDLIDENATWQNSEIHSGYGISKYSGEKEVWRGIEEGLNAVIVNPSVILGAACHPKAVNPVLNGINKLLPFYSNGVTGYVDVRDVVKAMILLMESDISAERYVLNSENLSQRELFTICAVLLGRKNPYIHLNKPLLNLFRIEEALRSTITGNRPLITRENVNSVTGINRYSSDKFRLRFGYEFIPVKESLSNAFQILKMLNKKE